MVVFSSAGCSKVEQRQGGESHLLKRPHEFFHAVEPKSPISLQDTLTAAFEPALEEAGLWSVND